MTASVVQRVFFMYLFLFWHSIRFMFLGISGEEGREIQLNLQVLNKFPRLILVDVFGTADCDKYASIKRTLHIKQ